MTLISEVNLDILEIYLHTKNEVYKSRPSKVRDGTGQTDRDTEDAIERITTTHLQW